MAQAWMVRAGQQQRLIEGLVNKFYDTLKNLDDLIETKDITLEEAYERSEAMRHEFTQILLLQLVAGHKLSWGSRFIQKKVEKFIEKISKEIKDFSRVKEEETALGWRFLLEISKIRANQCEQALQRLELKDPPKIFHALSATDEVEDDG